MDFPHVGCERTVALWRQEPGAGGNISEFAR